MKENVGERSVGIDAESSESDIERSREEVKIRDVLANLTAFSRMVRELEPQLPFPEDGRDIIVNLCIAQQALLEEKLHAIRPELHPETTVGGAPYSHRQEALMHLKNALDGLKGNVRTIRGETVE